MIFNDLKTFITLPLSVLLLPFIVLGCVASNPRLTDAPSYTETDGFAKIVIEAYSAVRKHYADETSPSRLVSAAIAGMEEMLTSQNQVFTKPTLNFQADVEDKQAIELLASAIIHYSNTTGVKHDLLEHAAIREMFNTLDPLSFFMTPAVYKDFKMEQEERFASVGLILGIREGRLIVIAPIEGSSAQRAGIQAGDYITMINNEPTKDLSKTGEAAQHLRGPRGTTITMTVERKGNIQPLAFTIVREIVKIKGVESKILDGNIGYIRLYQFQDQTAKDLTTALKKLREQKIQSLIIDLRNNPGGLLTAAIDVSEQFLGLNRLIVYIKTRDGRKDEYSSYIKEQPADYPVMVLVNEVSAAASEIVAGALQDWRRALITGIPTAGHGTVQKFIRLSDGSVLKLTVARTYTPKGRSIEDKIQPDIIVEEKTDEDAILAAVLHKLQSSVTK